MSDQINPKFSEDLEMVVRHLETGVKDRAGAKQILSELKRLPRQELEIAITEISNGLKTKDLQANDPSFTATNAFVNGALDVAILGGQEEIAAAVTAGKKALTGSDKSFAQNFKEDRDRREERKSLLYAENPGTRVAGNVGGFAAGAGQALVKTGVAQATKALSKTAGIPVIERLSQTFLAKSTAQAGLGNALFEAGASAVDATGNLISGTDTPVGAIKDVVGDFIHGGETGIKFGFGLGVLGSTAAVSARILTKPARAGLSKLTSELRGGSKSGSVLQDLDTIDNILTHKPEVIFAESAGAIAPRSAAIQQRLNSVRSEAQRDLVKLASERKIKLTGDLQFTADSMNTAMAEIRQGALAEMADNAANLNQQTRSAYSQINQKYGEGLSKALETNKTPVDLSPVLNAVEGELRAMRALDKLGRPDPMGFGAKRDPELFAKLSDFHQQLKVIRGREMGSPVKKVNAQDALDFKKSVGEFTNFNSPNNNFERVMGKIYNQAKVQSEKAIPELKGINAEYSVNRKQIDRVRSALGRTDAATMAKMQKNLGDNKNILLREALEAFGEFNPGAAPTVQKTLQGSELLNLISGFEKNPKAVFKQIQAAYLGEDLQAIKHLNRIADRLPNLRPYLNAAESQAQILKNLPSAQAAKQSLNDPMLAATVSEQIPGARQVMQGVNQASQQAAELRRVLPADRMMLEKRLANPKFGQSEIEKQVIQGAIEQDPALAGPISRAGVTRAATQVDAAVNETLQSIPGVGPGLKHVVRYMKPKAVKGLVKLAKYSEKAKQEWASGVLGRVAGTDQLPKAAVLTLQHRIGPEETLRLYAESGGGEEIAAILDDEDR